MSHLVFNYERMQKSTPRFLKRNVLIIHKTNKQKKKKIPINLTSRFLFHFDENKHISTFNYGEQGRCLEKYQTCRN